MYIPNPSIFSNMFAIPTDVLNIALEGTSKENLLAILWIFKHSDQAISINALTGALCCSADTALAALDFWVKKGILSFTDDSGNVRFIRKESKAAEQTPTESKTRDASPASLPVLPTITFSKPNMEQISARMHEDKEVLALFNEAQSILGRTFGVELQGTLLTFLDTYGLPKEIILTLLQHLVEIGKSSNANIARIGKIWAEKEINTISDANEYIQNDTAIQKLYSKLRMEAGFNAVSPTAKQAEIIGQWIEAHYSFEMILDAYEASVERNSKYPIPYMDKILQSWKNQGSQTLEDRKNQKKSKKASFSTPSSFDLDEAVKKATLSSKK